MKSDKKLKIYFRLLKNDNFTGTSINAKNLLSK